MSYQFSERSKRNLSEAAPPLQKLFNEVIKYYDCAVICGHRGQAEQDAAYHAGTSQKKFPESKHNQTPSLAVDVVPYPIDWQDKERFRYFGGLVKGLAIGLGIPIRWGGDWDGDNDFTDQTLHDLPHFEIEEGV